MRDKQCMIDQLKTKTTIANTDTICMWVGVNKINSNIN